MKGNEIILSLLLLQGCALMPQKPVAYATVPSEQQEREARLAEQAKRQEDQRRKEKEKEEQEKQEERGLAELRKQVPCDFAQFNGYAFGYINAAEYKPDERYLQDMVDIYPITCRYEPGWGRSCFGFYRGHQRVKVDSAIGNTKRGFIGITAKLLMTSGYVSVLLLTVPKYLSCR